jgi:hypothetical protein
MLATMKREAPEEHEAVGTGEIPLKKAKHQCRETPAAEQA